MRHEFVLSVETPDGVSTEDVYTRVSAAVTDMDSNDWSFSLSRPISSSPVLMYRVDCQKERGGPFRMFATISDVDDGRAMRAMRLKTAGIAAHYWALIHITSSGGQRVVGEIPGIDSKTATEVTG